MTTPNEDLERIAAQLAGHPGPLVLSWPGHWPPVGFRTFDSFEVWKACILDLELTPAAPLTLVSKYHRARELFLMGWLDADIIIAGEMAAFAALELAMNDCYRPAVIAARKPLKPSPKPADPPKVSLAQMLDHMVRKDGVTDALLPIVQRYGGTYCGRLPMKDGARPSLADIRNDLAHGYPFDRPPRGELLELIRDLIGYAYRDKPPVQIIQWEPEAADLSAATW